MIIFYEAIMYKIVQVAGSAVRTGASSEAMANISVWNAIHCPFAQRLLIALALKVLFVL